MRITNKSLVKSFLSDLSNNLENMSKVQQQLSSGKEIRRPSDDPFKVARSLELNNSISINERYKTNIDEGTDWLNTTDSALGQIGEAIQRVRELTVAAGNGTYTQNEKDATSEELTQLKKQIIQIGNTAYDGRYIFAGDQTETPPFAVTDNDTGTVKEGKYVGSETSLRREFSQGVVMDDFGVCGSAFQPIIGAIDNVITALKSGGSASSELGNIDAQMNKVLEVRANVGARGKRLEAMSEKNEDETYNMTELLSKTEDIDVAQKYTESKLLESVYNSSLQSGSKIIQPSLLDFIR